MRRLLAFGGLEAHFAYFDAHFLLGKPALNSPSPETLNQRVSLVRLSRNQISYQSVFVPNSGQKHRNALKKTMCDVTEILSKVEAGDQVAADQLFALVYDELRKMAAARMAHEKADHTLQSTALVHEAFIRLVDRNSAQYFETRGHFFAAASESMRRILIEAARGRKAAKRHGGERESLTRLIHVRGLSDDKLLELNEVLEQLEQQDPETATLVKLRFFGGFSMQEIAQQQGISIRKAHYLWDFGRSWLKHRLSSGDASSNRL